MQAEAVTVGIGDPRHPADAGLDGLDENSYAEFPALRYGFGPIVHG